MPGENEKVAELEGQVTDLEAQVEDLTKKLAKAIEASTDAKAASELQGQVTALTGKVEELTTAQATAETKVTEALAEAEEIAKATDEMDEDEREHYRGLDKDAKSKWRKMSGAERKKAMKVRKENDEEVLIEGRTIRKSAVGEDMFAIMKSQAERIAKGEAEMAKEREARETAELTKRADDQYPHVPGSTAERAGMLKVISKLDEPLRKSFESVLEQSEKLAKAGFERIGSRGKDVVPESVQKAAQSFNTKAAEIRKRDNCTRTESLDKARREFPELFKAFQEAEAAAETNAN